MTGPLQVEPGAGDRGAPARRPRVKALRALGFLAVALVLITVAGHWSGRQPERDALAAAKRELGIELESRRVEVGDVTLHVVLAGPEDGAPVVLLHGFPEFWYAWARPMAILAQRGFRVAVPDQRGYGESDKPRGIAAYRVDTLTSDVVGLIRALGFERTHIVGHDWGGRVAWQLAIDHPEVVDRLAVIGTPHPEAAETVISRERSSSWHWTFFQLPWLPEWSARVANWRVTSSLLRSSSLPGTFPEEKLDLYRSAWAQQGAFEAMVNWYRAAYRHPPSSAAPRRVSMPALVLDRARRSFPPLGRGSSERTFPR